MHKMPARHVLLCDMSILAYAGFHRRWLDHFAYHQPFASGPNSCVTCPACRAHNSCCAAARAAAACLSLGLHDEPAQSAHAPATASAPITCVVLRKLAALTSLHRSLQFWLAQSAEPSGMILLSSEMGSCLCITRQKLPALMIALWLQVVKDVHELLYYMTQLQFSKR